MTKRIVLILFLFAAVGAAVWAALRFVRPRWQGQAGHDSADAAATATADTWYQAVEKVKADRGESAASTCVETPPELKHYSERHWFLATQVAEIAKYNVHTVPGLHGPRRDDRTR